MAVPCCNVNTNILSAEVRPIPPRTPVSEGNGYNRTVPGEKRYNMNGENKCGEAVVHERQDSGEILKELFDEDRIRNANKVNSLIYRDLPKSFFNPGPTNNSLDQTTASNHVNVRGKGSNSSASHSRTNSSDSTGYHNRSNSCPDQTPYFAVVSSPQSKDETMEPPKKSMELPLFLMQNLPENWDVNLTPEQQIYFIDHNKHITTWFDPRLPEKVQSAAMKVDHLLRLHYQYGGSDLEHLACSLRQGGNPMNSAVMTAVSPMHITGQLSPVQSLGSPMSPSNSVGTTSTSGSINTSLSPTLNTLDSSSPQSSQEDIMKKIDMVKQQKETLGKIQQQLELRLQGVIPSESIDDHKKQSSIDSGLGGMNFSLQLNQEAEYLPMDTTGLEVSDLCTGIDDNMNGDDLMPSIQEDLHLSPQLQHSPTWL